MTLESIIIVAVVLVIAIGLHEYAHARMSNRLGDPTPRLQGRLTPNPLAHLDPIGFLLIFIIHFGRGKPVQINPRYYKDPLKGELLVALAGPATNIILSIIGMVFVLVYARLSGLSPISILYQDSLMMAFRTQFIMINIALAVFNMIPLPPLDGFNLIKIRNPRRAARVQQYTMQISVVFLLLVLFGSSVGNFISTVAGGIFSFLYGILSTLVFL